MLLHLVQSAVQRVCKRALRIKMLATLYRDEPHHHRFRALHQVDSQPTFDHDSIGPRQTKRSRVFIVS